MGADNHPEDPELSAPWGWTSSDRGEEDEETSPEPGQTADPLPPQPQVATEPERQPERGSGAQACRWCGGPLSGAQTHYDSATCKAKQNAFEHSLDRLASLPETEFRELLRGVCEQRYFTPWKRGGRLHIRWGEYKESQEDPETREQRLATWEEVDPEVKKLGNLHIWQGIVARRLSWIAQYLRLLDRASKAGRGRRENV